MRVACVVSMAHASLSLLLILTLELFSLVGMDSYYTVPGRFAVNGTDKQTSNIRRERTGMDVDSAVLASQEFSWCRKNDGNVNVSTCKGIFQ